MAEKLELTGKSKPWTLDEALYLIRQIQPLVMEAGYYLALGGGVPNKGESHSDLDLVAVARTDTSDPYDLSRVFDRLRMLAVDSDYVTGHLWLALDYLGHRIELVVIQPGPLGRT